MHFLEKRREGLSFREVLGFFLHFFSNNPALFHFVVINIRRSRPRQALLLGFDLLKQRVDLVDEGCLRLCL